MADEDDDLQRLFQAGLDAGRPDFELEPETAAYPLINLSGLLADLKPKTWVLT